MPLNVLQTMVNNGSAQHEERGGLTIVLWILGWGRRDCIVMRVDER